MGASPVFELAGWVTAIVLWCVALLTCPGIARGVLQATRLAFLYAFARG